MFRVLKASSLLLATSIVSGCISQPAAIVSAPLQPAANEPTTYLVGADGKIARIWDKVKVAGHAEEVLAAAKAL